MSYEPVSDGELAAVVTYLEMKSPRREPAPSAPLALRKIDRPDLAGYRAMFRRVGGRWLWFSRLIMPDDQLRAIIGDPGVELFAVVTGESEVGMLELDFRTPGECELAFVGLVPEWAGRGHGRWLLSEAVHLAWRDGIGRVHVHTCSLDHPAALRAYERAGFTAYKRAVERFPDPRLLGVLPLDCAPQVPLVGTLAIASDRPDS